MTTCPVCGLAGVVAKRCAYCRATIGRRYAVRVDSWVTVSRLSGRGGVVSWSAPRFGARGAKLAKLVRRGKDAIRRGQR